MKVAIVHDWLTVVGGGERVLEQLLTVYPEADLFTVVDFLSDEDRQIVHGKRAQTTFIQGLPFARKRYRHFLPLMPLAIEQLDMSAYDLVISSSHAVAKGVITGPDQLHVSYIHSPIRYAWDLQHEYLRESGLTKGTKSWMARGILSYMRMWDSRTVHGIDHMVANSAFIAKRIRKCYGRAAQVIHPPVDISAFAFRENKDSFFLTASRMVPYKRIDLIVDAFAAMPHRRLVVVGDGPEFERIKARATPNVEMTGHLPRPALIDLMQRARAFVFAAREDFGIVAVEAQACGTPVIAFGSGGVCESVIGEGDGAPTGVFFPDQSAASIINAIDRFDLAHQMIEPSFCRRNAERFSPARFRQEFRDCVRGLQGEGQAADDTRSRAMPSLIG
jgi:glycosyltransferase involved in cell wall biosynthesis